MLRTVTITACDLQEQKTPQQLPSGPDKQQQQQPPVPAPPTAPLGERAKGMAAKIRANVAKQQQVKRQPQLLPGASGANSPKYETMRQHVLNLISTGKVDGSWTLQKATEDIVYLHGSVQKQLLMVCLAVALVKQHWGDMHKRTRFACLKAWYQHLQHTRGVNKIDDLQVTARVGRVLLWIYEQRQLRNHKAPTIALEGKVWLPSCQDV